MGGTFEPFLFVGSTSISPSLKRKNVGDLTVAIYFHKKSFNTLFFFLLQLIGRGVNCRPLEKSEHIGLLGHSSDEPRHANRRTDIQTHGKKGKTVFMVECVRSNFFLSFSPLLSFVVCKLLTILIFSLPFLQLFVRPAQRD